MSVEHKKIMEMERFVQNICGNEVRIREDRMSAGLELVAPPEGTEYTKEELLSLLKQQGVTHGIREDVIERMVKEKIYYRELDVAQGRPPENGKDASFRYHFNPNPRSAPKVLEDGSVDYRNLECFESVAAGQLIAEYIPETFGVDGVDVKGNVLPAKRGRPKPAIRGKHITMDEERTHFYSDVNGKITMDPDTGKIVISDSMTITSDVDASTGNISFKGDLEIMGSITAGYHVETTGSLVVKGIVEAATIKAGKDVILKSGMSGAGRGTIVAGGNVEGRFFEQTNIECGGYVHANSIMNCFITTKDRIEVAGSRGVLLAGRVHAIKGVDAVNIGNVAQIPTYIKVGMDPKSRRILEETKRKIGELSADIEKLTKMQATLSAVNFKQEKKQGMEQKRLEIMRTKITLTTSLDALKVQAQELERQIADGRSAIVTASECAHAGCSITINGVTNNVKQDVVNVMFCLRNGNVVMNYKE